MFICLENLEYLESLKHLENLDYLKQSSFISLTKNHHCSSVLMGWGINHTSFNSQFPNPLVLRQLS